MRRLVAIVIAALFSAVTFSAYAADPAAPDATTQKQAKKKKKSSGVSSKGHKMDKSGQGAPSSTGAGGVKAGGESVSQPGRADPTVGKGAGGVTSAPSNAPGRSDSK